MSATQSALDQMTAAVIQKKVEKGAKLTPVGLEGIPGNSSGAPLGTTNASFPNDVPGEAILQTVLALEDLFGRIATLDEKQEAIEAQKADLRRLVHAQYADIRKSLDAVKVELGMTPAGPVADQDAAQKEREAEADARARLATIAAQAAAEPVDDDAELPAPSETEEPSGEDAAKAAVLARIDQKTAEAQAATFTPPAAEPVTSDGWTCPTHGQFTVATSRLGRAYLKCPQPACKQFEKKL